MRTTIKSIAAAAVAVLASAASYAGAPETTTFTRDGRTYVYTQTPRDGGGYVLAGYEKGSHKRFRLIVDGEHVSGYSNGYPVSFRAPQADGVAVAAN